MLGNTHRVCHALGGERNELHPYSLACSLLLHYTTFALAAPKARAKPNCRHIQLSKGYVPFAVAGTESTTFSKNTCCHLTFLIISLPATGNR